MSIDDPLVAMTQRITALEKEVERMKCFDIPKSRDPIHFESTPISSVNYSPKNNNSTTAKTKIVMATEFPTAPTTEVIGYYFYIAVHDSGSAAGSCYVLVSDNSSAGVGAFVDASGLTNDAWERNMVWVPCDANGDIYHSILATGVSTLDFYLNLAGWVYKS